MVPASFNINPNVAPTLFNLITGLAPDLTIRESVVENFYTNSNFSFSEAVMQTTFHELGHASHYLNVGDNFWLTYIGAILRPVADCNSNGIQDDGYGCGNEPNAGMIQISEAWAEFIGTFYALRLHPDGRKISVELSPTVFIGGEEFAVALRHDFCLERERFFFNNWIPTGIFNDLMDGPTANVNTPIINDPAETWDVATGVSVQQLYNALQSDVRGACPYLTRFMDMNPSSGIGFNAINDIFVNHMIFGCTP